MKYCISFFLLFMILGVAAQLPKTNKEFNPWIAEPQYRNASMFNDGVAPVQGENNKWKYINMTGKQAFPFIYEHAESFSEGVATVLTKEDKWQLINKQGVPITKMLFNKKPSYCKNGLIAVNVNDKWGYMNKSGKMVIAPVYFEALQFSEGLAAVWSNDSTCSFINTAGKTIITGHNTPSYNQNAIFQYGYALVGRAGKYYFISKTGKTINEPADKSWKFLPFDTRSFVEGMLRVEDPKTKLRGAIDTSGKLIIPTKFNDLHNFSDGWAKFNNNKKWSYIDKTGNIVMNTVFPIAENYKNGFAGTADKSTGSWVWYFVNKYGAVVPGLKFDEIIDWNNDVALVKVGGGLGFINMKLFEADKHTRPVGNSPVSDNQKKPPLLNMFRDTNGLYGFHDINNGFAIVIPAQYKRVGKVSEGLIAVTKDGDKWGYVDETGKLMIPYRFMSAKEFVNGKALVEEGVFLDSEKFYIDRNGKRIQN